MLIKELIEELKKYPQDSRVVVQGYEEGYNDITAISQLKIALNVHKEDYYGAHENSKYVKTPAERADAVLLFGTNTNAED
jgi:hypothetical protein